MPELLPHGGQHNVDPARAADDVRHRTGCVICIVALQPVDEPAEFSCSRPPITADRPAPLEEQRQCTGIRLRRRFGAVTADAEMKKPVVHALDRPIAAVDDGPVAPTRRQLDPKRLERPHRPRRYDPERGVAVNVTPADCVADSP